MTPAQIAAWDLDEATIQMIEDRFYYREICDDDKMERFFQRTLDTVRDRYRSILRIETIKFDPLVSRYFEGEFTTNGTENVETTCVNSASISKLGSNTKQEVHNEHTDNDFDVKVDSEHFEGGYDETGAFSKEGHDDREGNNTTNGTVRSQHTNNTSSNTTDHSTNHSETAGTSGQIDRHAGKQAPMNASGVSLNNKVVGDTTGMLSGLDFDYATMYSQDDRSNKNASETDDENNSTSATTGSDQGTSQDTTSNTHVIHEGVDRADSGEDEKHHEYEDDHTHQYRDERDLTVAGGYTINDSQSGSETRSGTSGQTSDASKYQIRHDRYTGRDNVLPQDALKAAMNYLQNYSTAFEWLCNKLEINFIGIYDI